MTDDEVKSWRERLSEDQLLGILKDYEILRHALCERTLLVPTGAPDWVRRSVLRAEQLSEYQRECRKLINTISEAVEEAIWRTKIRTCQNCQGTKVVGDHSCVCCGGTGLAKLPQS